MSNDSRRVSPDVAGRPRVGRSLVRAGVVRVASVVGNGMSAGEKRALGVANRRDP